MLPRERIVSRREALKLSRAQLAKKLGLTRRQLWRLETGEVRIVAEDMPKIAKALRTSVSALYGE